LVEAMDAARFGGKAVELGAALRAGLPVPDGVALSVEVVDAAAAGEASAIAAVRQVFERLGGGPVAARSSAVGEDGQSASFAGQHATKLNVRSADRLVEAVVAVRASGHTEAAIAYRKRTGVAGAPRVAVAVQRLVHAELAGVLFTRCPVSGREERVIEAARGLGEVVVAGLINPERWRVGRDGRVIERTAADQDLMIVATGDGGTEEREVTDRKAPVLGEHHVRALDELACTCERVFGAGGHDIEWAFAKGSLYLLQRRPITR
jgi:pyruvate,water dikinase